MAITGGDINGMVRHWLKTPVGGYLGSDYGQDLKALLQRPLAQVDAVDAQDVLNKLRADVAVLDALPAGSVNLYSLSSPPDRTDLVIEIAGQAIDAGTIEG
ncbi:hypothetical protein [Uliginosibacterium sediminicola]|uniref:Uncharacterized protein n=1 Tax=Uliginosibacterium sediminicola TaxID=2024550 RepID=A0ABU9YW90_9RHOO